jgi:hypothetical protein
LSVDRSLYEAPQGIAALSATAEPLEIEIILDSDDDRAENVAEAIEKDSDDFNENLAEILPDSVQTKLVSELLADYETDLNSRKDWMDTYIKGLKLLGLKYDERTEPWAGACGVHHPLLMESAVKFTSETIMEVFPTAGPVKTKIIGKETPEKLAAALRVAADMNYQFTDVMLEYRPEHERLLTSLCLAGNAFKKVFFDPSLGRQAAPYIAAEDVIVPYGATNIETAERITHRMRKTPNELRRLQVEGFYIDKDLGEPQVIFDEIDKQKATEQGFSATKDDRFQLLEMHVDLDLEDYEDMRNGKETGIKLPYVVTIEKGTRTVLAVRRNWLKEDRLKFRRQHFVHYGYIPGFGFYYFGLIHLIGGHTKAATSLLRQLIDCGTLANLPGGLKARGLRIKGDDTPIAPGEFRDVDIPSGAIRDNILPLPYKEPSQTLLALMNQVIEDGRRFAAVSDIKISDMSANSPVGTTLAILERVLKVMSAVQARIHFAMKQEFKLLAAIIRDNTPDSYEYEPEVGPASAKKSDYDCCDVLPVSDPNASTMSQRVVQYQAVLQLSQTAPQIYDLPFLHRQMIETLGVKNSQKIIPMKEDMQPVDPVTENMNVLMGKPVKAFQCQDHEAHIAVHMSAMQDPKMMAMVGQNPQAQMIMAAGAAHLMEHVAWQYRREIEKQLGAVLPPPPDFDEQTGYLDPAIENQVSALAAQAAAKLLQKDQQEFQAQQNAQQSQDPLIQMQQQELQLKAQELQLKQQVAAQKNQIDQLKMQIAQAEQQRKSQKDMVDAAALKDNLDFEKQQAATQSHLEGAKIGVDIAKHKAQTTVQAAQAADRNKVDESRLSLDGAKLGVEIAKHKAEQGKDIHKHAVDKAVDVHKHAIDTNTDLRKHAASLNTEMHNHGGQIDADLYKHQTGLDHEQAEAEKEREHQKEIEKQKAAAAKQAAKNKPKPTGKK